MENKMKHSSSFKILKSTTWCLLVVVTLQFIALSKCQSSESGSVLMIPCADCKQGEICTRREDGTSFCEQRNCNLNCTEEESKVCGSDGVTYKNQCELETASCELSKDIRVEYSEECITLPPPPEPRCLKHQQRRASLTQSDLQSLGCDFKAIKNAREGELQLTDVLDCYMPNCEENQYKSKQCIRKWCWCSTADGLAINGTLQKTYLKEDTCENRAMCQVEDQVYNDGDVFTHPNGCGLCQCLNGTHSCYENYVPQPNGTLTEDQLILLKEEVLKVFLIQYNHKEHVEVDIRFIHQYPIQVTGSLKSKILRWKFEYYDRNKDGVLSEPEEFLFQMELDDFVRCKTFFAHVSDLMDSTNDNQITRQEWTSFFANELLEYASTSGSTSSDSGSSPLSAGLSKRSINGGVMPLGRKPLNLRKKFLYTFF